jgi:hypothetical protein
MLQFEVRYFWPRICHLLRRWGAGLATTAALFLRLGFRLFHFKLSTFAAYVSEVECVTRSNDCERTNNADTEVSDEGEHVVAVEGQELQKDSNCYHQQQEQHGCNGSDDSHGQSFAAITLVCFGVLLFYALIVVTAAALGRFVDHIRHWAARVCGAEDDPNETSLDEHETPQGEGNEHNAVQIRNVVCCYEHTDRSTDHGENWDQTNPEPFLG